MRKMIITFGYGNIFAGNPEDVLKIADMVESKLTKVRDVYEDGLHYVEEKDQEDFLSLSVTNKPLKPYSWYEELLEKRKDEA